MNSRGWGTPQNANSTLFLTRLARRSSLCSPQNAAVNEVLSRANLEPGTLGQMKGRITDVLEGKNQQARQLRDELER